jgi:hypothetical protein
LPVVEDGLDYAVVQKLGGARQIPGVVDHHHMCLVETARP